MLENGLKDINLMRGDLIYAEECLEEDYIVISEYLVIEINTWEEDSPYYGFGLMSVNNEVGNLLDKETFCFVVYLSETINGLKEYFIMNDIKPIRVIDGECLELKVY